MTLRGQALFALNLIRALTNLPPPLRVEASRINELPAWETYADRLGRSVYTDYAAAHRMKTLFDIPFMERSNPEARARVAQQQADLLARVSELDRKAASHWHDPGLHVFNHRPLTGVVGYYRMMDGDFAAAAPLFRVARECVSNVSLWRLQYTWYLLSCNRRVHPALTDDDRLLCQEAIEVGELLERFVGFPEPLGPGFLGMAHHRLGEYAKAVEYLDDVVGYAKSSESVEVVEALADSLVRLGQVDRARYLLTLAQKDPAMEEMAQRMLSAIERGAARSPETPP
jgi:hypothetical protein